MVCGRKGDRHDRKSAGGKGQRENFHHVPRTRVSILRDKYGEGAGCSPKGSSGGKMEYSLGKEKPVLKVTGSEEGHLAGNFETLLKKNKAARR